MGLVNHFVTAKGTLFENPSQGRRKPDGKRACLFLSSI
jgi:hypothetical protein